MNIKYLLDDERVQHLLGGISIVCFSVLFLSFLLCAFLLENDNNNKKKEKKRGQHGGSRNEVVDMNNHPQLRLN